MLFTDDFKANGWWRFLLAVSAMRTNILWLLDSVILSRNTNCRIWSLVVFLEALGFCLDCSLG